jgi:hypothetical protein
MTTVDVLKPIIRQRPRTAEDKSSYCPTDPCLREQQQGTSVEWLENTAGVHNQHDMTAQDDMMIPRLLNRPNTAPVPSKENHIVRDLEKQNSNFRSARYLAMQWRSRSAQWSASSSIRTFKTSSSLFSSPPPPPLREYDSDSDSSMQNISADDSVVSQVSEAHKMLETWKHRSMSLSTENQSSFLSVSENDDDDEKTLRDSLHEANNQEEVVTSNSGHDFSDEFDVVDSFA